MNALRNAPGGSLSGARLRSSLVSVGGDGAEVSGGPGARHSSSAAADKLYQTVFPGAELVLTDWDVFHRGEIAGRRAVGKVGLCMEIFDVGQMMLQLFGVGAGRFLHRQIAEPLNDDLKRTLKGNSKDYNLGVE